MIKTSIECSSEKKSKIKETLAETRNKRKSQVGFVYELKIDYRRLNRKQQEELQMLFIEGKRFYNDVLRQNKEEHKLFSDVDTKSNEVIVLNKDKEKEKVRLTYLKSSQKQAIVSKMISNLKTIISLQKRGFQKHGELKFKSEFNCIPLKQYGITHKIVSSCKFKIQGISKNVKVFGLKQIPLELNPDFANANLIKKPDGYYIHLTAFIDKEKLPKKNSNGKEIGIDFGCKTSLTFSDGQKVNVQIEESERLKKLQTKLNRHQTKRSNNRNKTINKIRREFQKTTNKKKDKANQICSKLKNYDLVVIQDEQLKNWHKGRHGKKIQYSCMGLIKTKLQSYSNVVVLDRFIPTTKFCSRCGKKHNELKLWNRIFKCDCGIEIDRDVHAAQNMLDIFHLVDDYFVEHKLLPSDQGKVKLAEFKTAISGSFGSKTSHKTLKQEDAIL